MILDLLLTHPLGDVVGQIVTLANFGGDATTVDGILIPFFFFSPLSLFLSNLLSDIEWFLAQHGAVQTELEEDPRIARALKSKVNFNPKNATGGFVGKGEKRDSDDDDDEDDD